MKFTDDQLKIIEARDCNLLVSAAAGSGKTAVLVERIIGLITDENHPVDIDSLLVVTFTRAAAAQMRDKIADAISKKLDENPGNVVLQKQGALVHNAQITTIDSFCQYILRNSFADIDLDPGYRIADEGEIKLLMRDTLDEVLENLYSQGNEAFEYMVDSMVAGSGDDNLADTILSLYQTSTSHPWPRVWLEEHRSDYASGLSGEWFDELLDKIWTDIDSARELLTQALKLAEKSDGPYMYAEQIEQELEAINSIEHTSDLDELSAQIGRIEFKTLKRCTDSAVKADVKTRCSETRKEAKETIEKIASDYLGRSTGSHLEQMNRCDRVLSELVDITIEFMDRLDAVKKEKGILSFSDCEHLALNVLVHRADDGTRTITDAAREYRKHFSYVMIDEYQDSNEIQELILSAVSGEDDGIYNRFMVGDLKQSIYRFRQADPTIFIEKYNSYDENSDTHLVVDLHKNFRSRGQVLDAANHIFCKIMSDDLGGVDYNDKVALNLGADYKNAEDSAYRPELIIYDAGSDDELSSKELEAKGVATKIEEIKASLQVSDKDAPGGMRPANYGDIVILLRAVKSDAAVYKAALENRGIPVHITGTEGYFSKYEIQMLLHLLRIIDNPLQDVSFYGVMTSQIGGFIPEEVAMIRLLYLQSLENNKYTGEGYLYKACQYVTCVTDNNILRDKVSNFLDMLKMYRECSEYMSVEELLYKILDDTGYRAIVSAMRNGERRLANVEMLLAKAADYAQTSYYGLYNFLRYVDTIKKYEIDAEEAETIDENADVVRIMSIHKSKGLEFSVCFVSGMGKRFNRKDTSQWVVVDSDLGIGIGDIDPARRIKSGTLRREAIANRIRLNTMAEEERILYVALTRAMEKLIVTASISKPQETWDKFASDDVTIDPVTLSKSAGFYEWFMRSLSPDVQESPFDIHIVTGDEVRTEELSEDVDYELLRLNLDQVEERVAGDTTILVQEREYLTKLSKQEYPHPELKGLYTKTSVSELKHAAMPEDAEAAFDLLNLGLIAENEDADNDEEQGVVPRFISGTADKPGATVRGSAFHRAMELLDFTRKENYVNQEVLSAQLDYFVQRGSMSREARRIFDNRYDMSLLMKFWGNVVSDRMAQADRAGLLYKEAPFILGLPARLLNPDFPEKETVLIQGIIDAYWIEPDGAVILDYKTDRVKSADRLVELYQTQLDYYERALEKMGISVKEKLIYSFALDEVIRL